MYSEGVVDTQISISCNSKLAPRDQINKFFLRFLVAL